MAGCSSGIALSGVGILQKEAISRNKFRVGFRNCVKEAALPVFSGQICFRNVNARRKQNVVVMSMVPPRDGSKSGVAAGTSKEDGIRRVGGQESKGEPKIGGGGGDGVDGAVLDASGGNGKFPNGGGGGGEGDGGGDENEGDKEEGDYGRVLSFAEVMKEVKARGATLPSDMLDAAKNVGIHEVLLSRYLNLQVLYLLLFVVFLSVC